MNIKISCNYIKLFEYMYIYTIVQKFAISKIILKNLGRSLLCLPIKAVFI